MKLRSTWQRCCLALGLVAAGVSPLPACGDDSDWPPPPQPHFAPGMSDAELRVLVHEFVPASADPAAKPEARAIALREWLHAFLPVADSGICLSDTGYDHNGDDLGRMLEAVELRLGGYYCGGSAEIARRIYVLMGFDAAALDVGYRGTSSTHVTTLVRLPGAEGDIWSMQDSYFNFTLRDEQGALLGLREFYRLLAAGETERIVVDDPSLPKTPILYRDVAKVPRVNRRYDLQSECGRAWDGFEEFNVRWGYRLWSTSMFDYRRQNEARLGNSHPLYVFTAPLSLRQDGDNSTLWAMVQSGRNQILTATGASVEDLTRTVDLPPQPLDPMP